MKIKGLKYSVLLGLALCTGQASAANSANFEKPTPDQPSAETHGNTLPPIGYVEFCGRNEDECKFEGGKTEPLALNEQLWSQIRQVNKYVNGSIRPVADTENYGMVNYWTYPVNSGLCHSFALLKKRYLAELGINPDKLLMTVVLTEKGEGHAVLTIPTDHGDFILDNRRQEILRWDQTGYVFLKRQSQAQSRQWVSLQHGVDSPVAATIITSKGN